MTHEYIPVDFEVLVGSHLLGTVFLGPTLPSVGYQFARAYRRWTHEAWYPENATDYSDRLWCEVLDIRPKQEFLTLVTSEGRFTFEASTKLINAEAGLWEPSVACDRGQMVTLRFMPLDEPHHKSMYAVSEETGLVVLEFGTRTRIDEPNMRDFMAKRWHWEDGQGWGSPLLHPEVVIEGVEIVKPYHAPTPKHIGGGWRGSRKGRY